eukprot:366493-Chlamydomonas_euryale.AAC.7
MQCMSIELRGWGLVGNAMHEHLPGSAECVEAWACVAMHSDGQVRAAVGMVTACMLSRMERQLALSLLAH